jgi:hypothetical protein
MLPLMSTMKTVNRKTYATGSSTIAKLLQPEDSCRFIFCITDAFAKYAPLSLRFQTKMQ